METFPGPRSETFTTVQVCRLAGCSFRQLDYWVRTGTARPARDAYGSGSHRGWTARQVQCVWVLARLTELGCPTATMAAVYEALEANESLWAGPVLVEPGRGGLARPVLSVEDLDAGWVVDPRPALDAVPAGASVVA